VLELADGLVEVASLDAAEAPCLVAGGVRLDASPQPLVQGEARPERRHLGKHRVVGRAERWRLGDRHEVRHRRDALRQCLDGALDGFHGVRPRRGRHLGRDGIDLRLRARERLADSRLDVPGFDLLEGQAEATCQERIL
jgi:hypothetical protein